MNSDKIRCLFCKRIMKDDVFHVCPSRVPSMGKMVVPRNKKAAQQSEQADGVAVCAHECDFTNSLHCSICGAAQF